MQQQTETALEED